jgi:alpha-L-rhamnosidase
MKVSHMALLLGAALAIEAKPVHLRCEYLSDPLGIDVGKPGLSWQSDSTERNWVQSAYEVVVSSTPEALKNGKGDVWDSGKQNSGESVGIAYGGPKLESGKRYYWTVRVWDNKGRKSEAEQSAFWEMGLLRKEDWKAQWIRWHNPEEESDMAGIRWIWAPGEDATHVHVGTERHFHIDLNVAEVPERAALFLIARGDWAVTVNGRDAGSKPHWNEFDRRDLMGFLKTGANSIDISVKAPSPQPFGPNAGATEAAAGLAALIKLWHSDGTIERIPSDDKWQARVDTNAPWQTAAVSGKLGDAAFGGDPGPLPQPAALLRHEFTLQKDVVRARAYVTALGSYQFFVNGKRVAPYVLTPGFTQFEKRIQYQTYDVTSLVQKGRNVAAAVLGNGWFGSGISWTAEHFKVLPPPRLLAQIEVEYSDGSRDTLVTDGTWKTAPSPIVRNEIYAGETYDARLEQRGWADSGFNDSAWTEAVAADPYEGELSAQIDVPPQVVANLKPEHVDARPDGTYIFDMGQNMVGWVALNVQGKTGDTVRLRFAEILNPDGSIYTTNLRNADATDVYTLRGGEPETFVPSLTFHGFRYVEVSGYPGTPTASDITGQVVSSLAGEPTTTITTSSELVNHMWRLGIWGQRGNFLSVPTDCPQRDERLGWMADAAVFWRTGTFNFDTAAFTNKWMRDVSDAQLNNGAFTNVSPNIGVGTIEGAPGWGDAGVVVPWTTWIQYGNRAVVERHWDSMERWMQFIQDANPDFIRRKKVGPDFADWLAPDPATPKDLIDTAYWALIADMMSQIAHGLGRESDAKKYADLLANIRSAFQKAYVHPDGTVATGTQTCYVAALYMKLLPPELEKPAVDNLVKNIDAHNGHLTTGFLGTPYLLFTLGNHGRLDTAYKLLLNDTYPSWGYMVKKGATTWWERWNGDTGDPAMNSYNHYAFGSVMAWVYQVAAGIDTTTSGPGFHEITLQPHPSPQMTSVRAQYESVYGTIVSDWALATDGRVTLRCSIPPNTSAKIMIPGERTVKGKKMTEEKGQRFVQVGSGSWTLEMSAPGSLDRKEGGA